MPIPATIPRKTTRWMPTWNRPSSDWNNAEGKEEVESSRRRLEETHLRKARFMDQQNELGDRMVNAADLIGREVESLRQESNELEQIHMALTRSLKMLSTVQPGRMAH